MKKQSLIIYVRSFEKTYDFVFIVHYSEASEHHQIEKDFYGSNIPKGIHLEAEIKNIAEFQKEQHLSKVHVHLSQKTGKQYVCWTGQISTLVDLNDMLRMWCVGSVYTLEHGVQFEKLLQDAGIEINDFHACREFFEQLGIHVKYSHQAPLKEETDRANYHFAKLKQ